MSLNFILYFYIENEDEEGKKRNFMKILSFTKKDWPIIVFGTVSLTLCSVGESFIPLILGKIVSGKKSFSRIIIKQCFLEYPCKLNKVILV